MRPNVYTKQNKFGSLKIRKTEKVQESQTDSGDGGDYFSQFQFIQDGGLSSSIQATIRILISFFPKRFLKRPANIFPMVADLQRRTEKVDGIRFLYARETEKRSTL